MTFLLSEILKIRSLPIYFIGDEQILNQPISSVSIDSRSVQPNELFFALKGEKYDAHQFIPDVLRKGVQAVVVAEDWFRESGSKGNFFITDNTLIALQEISSFYRSRFDIPFLAITGSNGKTTTKEMIAQVLSQKYRVIKNKGNLNNHIGVPQTLFELDSSHEVAIIEMGTNHYGEIKRLAEIVQPEYGLITNIGSAHLEFFGSLEGVAKAKSELWEFLEEHQGIAFVNVDDPLLARKIPKTNKVITYGFHQKADVQGKFEGVDEFGYASFHVMGTAIKLKVAGMHNIYNSLSAVSVGLEFNLDIDQIKRSLEDFLPTAKRMEVIRQEGVIFLNDCYNSNPTSAEKALITLSQIRTTGRRIAVLADMLELGEKSPELHAEIGEKAAALKLDHLLALGPLSKYTVEMARKKGLATALHFYDKMDLVEYLKKIIRQHDVILIKGSRGMAMEEVTAAVCDFLSAEPKNCQLKTN